MSNVSISINGVLVELDHTERDVWDHQTHRYRRVVEVPLRQLFQHNTMQYTVGWNGATREITVTGRVLRNSGNSLLFQIESSTFSRTVGDYHTPNIPLGAPARLVGNTTMIPLIAPLRALGYTVTSSRRVGIGMQRTTVIDINGSLPHRMEPPGPCRRSPNVRDHLRDNGSFEVITETNPIRGRRGDFRCTRCGDVFRSPENQDETALSPEDSLRVRAMLIAVTFYETMGDMTVVGQLLRQVDHIRRTACNRNTNRANPIYDYSNDGHYVAIYIDLYRNLGTSALSLGSRVVTVGWWRQNSNALRNAVTVMLSIAFPKAAPILFIESLFRAQSIMDVGRSALGFLLGGSGSMVLENLGLILDMNDTFLELNQPKQEAENDIAVEIFIQNMCCRPIFVTVVFTPNRRWKFTKHDDVIQWCTTCLD